MTDIDKARQAFERGESFHQSGQLDEALRWYRKALEVQPENALVLRNLGLVLQTQGNLDEAVANYRQAVSNKPDFAVAHYNLGNALIAQGKLDEALSSYQNAVAVASDFAEAHSNLGNTQLGLGKPDDAVSSYRKAVSIEPEFADAHYNLGNVLSEEGKLDEAVSSYRKAASIRPDFADAHYVLGNALRRQGRLDEAIASYRKAVSIRPDIAEAHSKLGDALIEQGRLDEAVSSFRKAVSISPDIAEAHSNLGNALREQGNLDEAVSSYEKAVSIKPDFVEARHILNALLGHTTRQPPREYVETLFNEFATTFDSHLVNELEYSTPSLLKEALLDLNLLGETQSSALDLGCGTGLAGAEFRELAESLVGIDLSENMVREAEKKNIYDDLYVNDIVAGLNALETQFDLFIAADVFTYIGDLLELFNCVEKRATKNALFVFSTEHENCEEYVLQSTGRYAHSKDYVLSIATQTGFYLEYFAQSKIRRENDAWIDGGIYVLRRGVSRT